MPHMSLLALINYGSYAIFISGIHFYFVLEEKDKYSDTLTKRNES